MKILIAVTNATALGLAEEVAAGKHHRVDYMELARYLETVYVDYNTIPVHRLEEKARLNFRQAWAVARMVQRDGYEAVLSMSERVGIPLTYLLPRRVKHVVIAHHPLSPAKLRMMRMLRLEHRFDKILVLSQAEANALREKLNLRADEIDVLRFPTDTEFYHPQEAGQQDHIESLGLSYRDYPTLLRAMQKLPHITCYLRVGSIWTPHEGSQETEALPANVQIKPYVHPSVLRDCYAHSRFIVVPIRETTHWSAGSATVQQAQAMGRAVIATRLPGLSEYIIDGETGILVDVGDHEGMAAAIDDLWNNPQKTQTMGRRAREWVVANFSLNRWVNWLADLLCS